MIFWTAFGVYVVGWLLAIRPALRRRMLVNVCGGCGRDWSPDQHANCVKTVLNDRGFIQRAEPARFVPRGAVRDRNGVDALVAVTCALFWPLLLLLRLVVAMVYFVGDGVLKAAPLTAPELERRLREREAEIERLTKQIDEAS